MMKLIGVCYEYNKEMLVFDEYPTNGLLYRAVSLSTILHPKLPTSLELPERIKDIFLKRLQIVQDLAVICHTLHSRRPPVYLIKFDAENIFIDENWRPKIVDMSNSIKLNRTSTKAQMTADIHSFGLLLYYLFPGNCSLKSPGLANSSLIALTTIYKNR
jgi:hypothetical protein